MSDKEKIIYYLNFAKTKLDNNNSSHIKAREEITELINKLKLEK